MCASGSEIKNRVTGMPDSVRVGNITEVPGRGVRERREFARVRGDWALHAHTSHVHMHVAPSPPGVPSRPASPVRRRPLFSRCAVHVHIVKSNQRVDNASVWHRGTAQAGASPEITAAGSCQNAFAVARPPEVGRVLAWASGGRFSGGRRRSTSWFSGRRCRLRSCSCMYSAETASPAALYRPRSRWWANATSAACHG